MTELIVKRATPPDASTVADILTEAALWMEKRSLNDWDIPYPLENSLNHINSKEVYLAYLGEKAVGTFCLQWDDERFWGAQPPDAGYLHRLAILPDLHGQNIGGRLLEWADSRIARDNRQYMRLDCAYDNAGLRSYYERRGFMYQGDIYGNHGYHGAKYERPVKH